VAIASKTNLLSIFFKALRVLVGYAAINMSILAMKMMRLGPHGTT
jgi:hypothetical protein